MMFKIEDVKQKQADDCFLEREIIVLDGELRGFHTLNDLIELRGWGYFKRNFIDDRSAYVFNEALSDYYEHIYPPIGLIDAFTGSTVHASGALKVYARANKLLYVGLYQWVCSGSKPSRFKKKRKISTFQLIRTSRGVVTEDGEAAFRGKIRNTPSNIDSFNRSTVSARNWKHYRNKQYKQ
ncbi:hypothetical protein ACI2KR_07795 [Pseudomonas luteola]